MLVAVVVGGIAEAELEGDLLAGVGIEIEAKCIETFDVERVGRGEPEIGIDGHGHDSSSGRAVKSIEVAQVEAGIFFRELGVEVVGHEDSL